MPAIRDFLLNLVLAIIPMIVGGITYVIINITSLQAEVKGVKDFYQEIVRSIDKRLDRIESKLDRVNNVRDSIQR